MKQNLIGAEASLLEALGRLNALSGSAITLFVTDISGRLLGTLTDGDIRRALLGGASLDSSVTEAMHTAFRAIGPADSGAAAVE
ncbi:MAG: CBS domain-containing protein, partial [Terasakiella sp.]|nr:CBS domain-containing protein [Terasakiella sp.]